ncbi:MAG TPA: FkbM family methyltransferase [Thermoanaerobaculia bacterium]
MLRRLLRLIPPGTVMRVFTGRLRGARWVVGAGTHGCWVGTYERDAQQTFAAHIKPGDVVYDIGANVGFFTLLAARLAGDGGHVYAFEPLPRNLTFLRRHLTLNRLTNVTVLPLAVAAAPGVARFQEGSNPSMGGLAPEGTLEVETSSLDALDLRPPRFMKIDVEGAESEVLAGALRTLRTHRPVIHLSTHGWQQHEHCLAVLRGEGYRIELERDGTEDGNYVVLATV